MSGGVGCRGRRVVVVDVRERVAREENSPKPHANDWPPVELPLENLRKPRLDPVPLRPNRRRPSTLFTNFICRTLYDKITQNLTASGNRLRLSSPVRCCVRVV